MEQGKTGKYFKYAIGEIVLVVIGILIALSINNWNENKKANIKLNKLLVNVFNDLEVDLATTQETIDYYRNKDTLANKIINGELSASYYKKNSILNPIFSNYRTYRITDMGYNALMQNTENIPSEYEELIADLNRQYIITAEGIESNLTLFASIVESTRMRYTLNFPWYSQNDSVSNEKRWQHLANDPIYKNEVQLYQRYGRNFSQYVREFYQQGFPLFLSLKATINDTSALPSFFPSNAEGFENVKSDYIGKYLNPSGNEFSIKEKNGFLFIYTNDRPLSILSMISKNKFKNHTNGRVLTFLRDESNKVIGWHNGAITYNTVDVND
ncbi:DUF6090 family protein [Gaetbulibacter sp. S0825]|uniref:DUF6090 family protein n=1 Tax=Gaetbulibacter sp. S0825 TaxID=2720084 RepID=UPI00244D9BD5|nr:DUF6090 family protein [Gaetbulibacter sp. S0825]